MTEEAVLRPGAVALVTGAGGGLGAAMAEALAARGVRVICAGRRRGPVEEVARRLDPPGFAFPLDVTDGAAVAALPGSLPEELREIDILINNAGSDLGGRIRFDEGAIEDFAGTIETNVTGLMRVTHAIAPGMVARGRGHIVNVGSLAALRPYAGGTAYVAAKAAVRAFSDCLRADYRNTGIRVTELMPGAARTGFAEARWRGDAARAEAFYRDIGTVLTPEDVARAAIFALEQPPHAVVAQILLVPTSQW